MMTERDTFEDLMSGMEDLFDGIEADDLTLVDSPSLVELVYELTEELLEMGEGLDPQTPEARDIHSRRNAAQVVLRERGVQI